jgi:phage protein D
MFAPWDDSMTEVRYVTQTEYDWVMAKIKREKEKKKEEMEEEALAKDKKGAKKKPPKKKKKVEEEESEIEEEPMPEIPPHEVANVSL